MNGSPSLPTMCCARCAYSRLEQIPPPAIQSMRFCKLLPPTPALMSTPNGVVAVPIRAPVGDTEFCFQFQAADAEQKPLMIPDGT